MKGRLIIPAALLVFAAALAADSEGFVRLTPDDMVWTEMDGGLAVSVIEGDPGGPGFYILRARFAPGVFSAPHYHPNTRYITVIEGTWWTGIGTVLDKDNTVPLGPGSYMKHPAGAAHYDGSKEGEVIVEIRGMGPAPLIYVDEDGNPRH